MHTGLAKPKILLDITGLVGRGTFAGDTKVGYISEETAAIVTHRASEGRRLSYGKPRRTKEGEAEVGSGKRGRKTGRRSRGITPSRKRSRSRSERKSNFI